MSKKHSDRFTVGSNLKVDKEVEQPMPADEPKRDATEGEIKKSTKTFAIVAGIIALIFIGIFLIPQFYKPEDVTISDLHEKNLKKGYNEEDQYVYNGFSFIYNDGSWFTQIVSPDKNAKYNIPLRFGPRDVENVSIAGDFSAFFAAVRDNDINIYQNQAYVVFDPAEEDLTHVNLAIGELNTNFRTVLNTHLEMACSEEHPQCDAFNATVISCEEATANAPVIYLKNAEETKVFENDYCVTIQGTEFELLRGVDRLLYKVYLVMD